MSSAKYKKYTLFSIIALSAVLLWSCPASAAQKYSVKGSGSCPSNQAVIRVLGTDGTIADNMSNSSRYIMGDQGFSTGKTLEANTMTLVCNGQTVHLMHNSVVFSTDESNEVSFSSVTISNFNTSDVAAIVPPITTAPVWCDLYLPEDSGGCIWDFPSAILLDRVKPDISGTNLTTGTLTPMPGGQNYWTWSFNDSGTPGDPDGANGASCPSCSSEECWKCNKSDTRYLAQIFRRKVPDIYSSSPVGSNDPTMGSVVDLNQTTTNDRFVQSPDTFCYVMRVEDTAGNWSVDSQQVNTDVTTLSKEKCVKPDGKLPVFQKVEYFKDYSPATGFSAQFPKDTLGRPVLTSNPCFFRSDCSRSFTRYIRVRVTVSEPLFDGQNHYGATIYSGDGFDNDNSGVVDEEAGGFNGADDDGDGVIDEDVAYSATVYGGAISDDRKDNDGDGFVDENHSNNTGGDSTTNSCEEKTLFDSAFSFRAEDKYCIKIPIIKILGPDTEGEVPSIANPQDKLNWVCTADGVTTNPECTGQPYGTTIYEFDWNVGRTGASDLGGVGLEEGQYDIVLTGADGVGNLTTEAEALVGSMVFMDNSGPAMQSEYFTSDSFTQKFAIKDHDNIATTTPQMPVVPAGNIYVRVSGNEYLGATPTVHIFLPNSGIPSYMGKPQQATHIEPALYTTCGQSSLCDPCTGLSCTGYATTTPCTVFKGCFSIAATDNNGYAGVTVEAVDLMSNKVWEKTDAEAAADRNDLDQLKDDTVADAIATYGRNPDNPSVGDPSVPLGDKDITLTDGAMFAIDTIAPSTPAVSFPVYPCNSDVARQMMSCLPAAKTTNSPTIKWTTLLNNSDDDVDGNTDEECVDGIDNDGDGGIDEDAKVCSYNGTNNWEIAQWRLQVGTDSAFATSAMLVNTIVSGNSYTLPVLAERSSATPYFWRVAPSDLGHNQGPYNPQYPLVPDTAPYFSFFVDTLPPAAGIDYYLDADCTVPMPRTPDGVPIAGDTADDPTKIICAKITTAEAVDVTATPTIKIKQFGAVLFSTPSIYFPSDNPSVPMTSFRTTFEIDAKGAGRLFDDGPAYIYFSTKDMYGNESLDLAPSTGTLFFIDAAAPECEINPAEPDPSSYDNDQDGILGEIIDDAVKITVRCNKYVGSYVKMRVKQYGFSSIPGMNDGLDNDCDGRIDEETGSTTDLDGDTVLGEDLGASQRSGSGCYIQAQFDSGSSFTYTGYYNIVPYSYDGDAQIFVGDTSMTSAYTQLDLIGNPIYLTGIFAVDTTPPAAPTRTKPTHNTILMVKLPQFGWRMQPRAADIYKYEIQIATNSNFSPVAATAEISDDGISSSFYYTLKAGDIRIPASSSTDPDDADLNGYKDFLTDNIYYWRMFTYDTSLNKSAAVAPYSFAVDTQPPGPPVFDAVSTPTQLTYSPLAGHTTPPEPASQVNIYVNDEYKGTVTTDSGGNFTVGIDDDNDGAIDEDQVDGLDNDLDSRIDEDPPGIFLIEGRNTVEGMVVDRGGNSGAKGCATDTPFFNTTLSKCIIERDSGIPMFSVKYYSDSALTIQLPKADKTTGKQVAKAGTIYMRITSTKELEQSGAPNPPKFTINMQGTTDVPETMAASIGGSLTEFTGSFTVNDESAPEFVDGDARVVVIGVDKQGNVTPPDTLPITGGYLAVDTKPPFFSITYWTDSPMQNPMTRSSLLLPITKAGSAYMRISSSEPASGTPMISVTQPGTSNITDAPVEKMDTTQILFKYAYTVNTADGGLYKDGIADVAITATDLAGNTSTLAVPTSGDKFIIDTTPPRKPTLVSAVTETSFTQIRMLGNVLNTEGVAEQYARVEIYVKLAISSTPDDGLDNDGDGRIDEEPNGNDGLDNDNDLFIDEDTTSNACAAGNFWNFDTKECSITLSTARIPNGLSSTDLSGGFTADVSGIIPGLNYIYARAIDTAGNISEFSDPATVAGKITTSITLTHDFPAGWNLVGMPLQPAIASPAAALGIGDLVIYQYKDGKYYYDTGMDPSAPGMCYWVFFPASRTVFSSGVTSTTNIVQLKKGWNLISLPYNIPVEFDSNIMVTTFTGNYDLGSTEANLYVVPSLYQLDPESDPLEYNPAVSLVDNFVIQPWEGFIIKALRDCTLIFPSQYSP